MAAPSGSRPELSSGSSVSSLRRESVEVARPPDAISGLGSVSATDALEFLDQLVAANRISQERTSRLRRKYNSLLESIESSRAAENALLMQSRDLQQQLAKDQTVLERVEGFPETDSSETTRLRTILLQQENELMQTEERIGLLEKEIHKLEDEEHDVQKEYDRLPKRAELEEKTRRITEEIEQLMNETDTRAVDTAKLQESIRVKMVTINDIQQEIDEVKILASSLQDELAEARLAPLNIPRDIDRITKAQQAAQDEIMAHQRVLDDLAHELSRYEEGSIGRKEELSSLATNIMNNGRINESLLVAFDNRDKQLANAKEREASLLEEGASVELQLRHKTAEHKLLFETFSSRNRDKDKELKQLKRGDLSRTTIENNLSQLKRRMDAMKQQVMTADGLAKDREKAIDDIKIDVDHAAKQLVEEEGMIEEGRAVLEHCMKIEQQYQAQARHQRNHVAELARQLVAITRSRDQDAKSYRKALKDQEIVDDALRTKTAQLEDQRKYEKEQKTQLKDFAQAYELIKTERNKTYAQIQNCHQAIMELREKIKILQNETEIQRTAAENKGKILSKSQMALVSKLQDRDGQQQELSHLRHQHHDQNDDIEQQRVVIHKLTQQINTFELTLNRLRARYEIAVQDRNDVGLQLIERNEEVCVFHEKINVQDSLIRNGNIELVEKEEEIRYLKMELAKLKNDIDTHHHMVSGKCSLERDLLRCQNELMGCRDSLKQLEIRVCDASDPSRVRVLAGSDPSCADLRDRITLLESQLTDCEQRLLEKELLLEQVSRLTDRANRKMESSRNPTIMVSGKVSSSQSKLREVTHKMMGIVSELSIQQAKALQLHQEIQQKEGKLEQAYARLEVGQAPDDETAQQWLQHIRKPPVAVISPNKEVLEEEGMRETGDGTITTAIPRPNAYLPDSEGALPVPKPYGSHAPFKPSVPGANMRHVRKPQQPPLDI